ncbi:MAG: hypothetical protein ACREP5_12505 [Candidatus Binatia bacterium]
MNIKDSHRDMSEQQVKKAERRAVFTEFPNVLGWCDPCAADPLLFDELPSQGAFSLKETPPEFFPGRGRCPIMPPMGGARDILTACILKPFDAPFGTPASAGGIPDFLLAYPAAA